MDIERFLELLDDPKRSRDELVTMRENALCKHELRFLRAAESVLDRRFPGWRTVAGGRGSGAQPTEVEFLGCKRQCDSEKDAYIWLIERLVEHYPQPFAKPGTHTLALARGGRGAMYFAKSLSALFGPQHQALATDKNKWHRLPNGWYAKLVLNETQKVELVKAYARLAGLQFGVDMDWNGRGRANPEVDGDELLKELLNLASNKA